ncbi:MAG: site-specific DNA-methyltransferase [Armatimonadota bacterium]
MSNGTDITITAAKGRPMLNWVGKRPLRQVTAFPAQHIETFAPSASTAPGMSTEVWEDWSAHYPQGGLLFHGDNKEVLAHLLANGFRGKVKLIYIDPPFDSGADYVRKVQLRGISGEAKLGGEEYTLGEQVQYTDIWANDNYLQFMYERLLLLKELLAGDGSIYLHCDSHKVHHLRCLLDEVFGDDNFKNDIVWQRFNYRADGLKYGTVHDTLLFYTKSSDYTFQKPYVSLKPSYIKSHFKPDSSGRSYRLDNLTAPAHGKTGKAMRFGDDIIAPPAGTMWRHKQEGIDKLWADGRIVFGDDSTPQIKRYLDEIDGQAVHSLWTDITSINSQAEERGDYPTQKPESLLERVIAASSNTGDIVLDCFIGSGTTAAVAQELGRRWIGCDINKGAIQTTSKRLQYIITEQVDSLKGTPAQGTLLKVEDDEDGGETLAPAQLAFTVWRVNDYDLTIQHNEAVNLACEHIGIERNRNDGFFDGTLGKRLVKITPFEHPLTPLDLEEIKRELDARPDEERGIVVVCLGKELAADAWVADWNRLRRGDDAMNKIEVIELRTSPKYGKFFAHQPAQVQVSIERHGNTAHVKVTDFISPTILERLQLDANLLQVKIPDWRSMVDCIMVDAAYNGEVFNVTLSDVPEKKTDMVKGEYDIPIQDGEITVAVKVIDMLGEEVIVTILV